MAGAADTTPEHTDELRIDLDPTPGVDLRRWCRRRPTRSGPARRATACVGYPKTTGNRGVHVYVRLEPRWDATTCAPPPSPSARELERRRPDLITAAWWKEERGTRVFVDFNQNAPHKTVFGAWWVRARPGAQVSTPFSWDELDAIHPDGSRSRTCPSGWRAGRPVGRDERRPQSLEPLLEMHARDLPAACSTRPGRRCTRSSRTSRRGSRPAGRARIVEPGSGRFEVGERRVLHHVVAVVHAEADRQQLRVGDVALDFAQHERELVAVAHGGGDQPHVPVDGRRDRAVVAEAREQLADLDELRQLEVDDVARLGPLLHGDRIPERAPHRLTRLRQFCVRQRVIDSPRANRDRLEPRARADGMEEVADVVPDGLAAEVELVGPSPGVERPRSSRRRTSARAA